MLPQRHVGDTLQVAAYTMDRKIYPYDYALHGGEEPYVHCALQQAVEEVGMRFHSLQYPKQLWQISGASSACEVQEAQTCVGFRGSSREVKG